MTGGALRREDIVLDGKLHQCRVRLQPKRVHQAVLVEGDRSRGDGQESGHFFHGVALDQQLQHLALAWRQLTGRLSAGGSLERRDHALGDQRRDV